MGFRSNTLVGIGRIVYCLMLASMLLQAQVSDSRYGKLARGMNLTRWFQYGSTLKITATDRDLLRNSGFTGVRIAVAPQYLLPKWATEAEIARNLRELDAGIDLFLGSEMSVTLDFQADAEYLNYYFAEPPAPGELVETWRMLAQRYSRRSPELLFFEIMNEPDGRFTQAEWDVEQKNALAAIRASAPFHTVLLAPVNWSGLDTLLAMKPYQDPNVIYVVHYYLPSLFTHQGATWAGAPASVSGLKGVPWPAFLTEAGDDPLLRRYRDDDWDVSRMEWDMGLLADWQRLWKARVVVNEFGVYKPNAPVESRLRWLRDLRTSIEGEHLAWAMWDYGGGFDFLQTPAGDRMADPGVLAALGLKPWSLEEPERSGPIPPFSGLRSVQIGSQPDTTGYAESIAAVDLNGDGLPDLVVAPITWPELTERPVQLFVNSGDGVMKPVGFAGPPVKQMFAGSIVTGRFDRSGRRGLFFPERGVEGGPGGQSSLALPLEGGRLRNATANLPQRLAKTVGAVTGDVDDDGFDDIVVFEPRPGLLRNDGTGHFVFDEQAFAGVSEGFRCGVFAGSNLVVFGSEDGMVLVNDGTGHFTQGAMLLAPPESGGAASGGCAVTRDLNADGHPDVIVAYRNDTVQVWIDAGGGTFRNETRARMGAMPASKGGIRRLALYADALVITRTGDAPLLRMDWGKGIFADPGGELSADLWVVVPGDFNQDGYLDLMFAQGGAAPLVARFGQSPL